MENQPHESTPWHNVEARYQSSQPVQGTVTRITHFGVFVQVEPGIEGVIYTFELGPGPAAMANFVPGQQVQLYVKSIDAGRKRMELCLEPLLMPGLLEAQAIPTALQRDKPAREQLSWPMPLPDTLLPLPSASPQAPIERTERACPNCQRTIQVAWQYCIYCGNALRRRCPACGNVQPHLPDARYCYECGKTLV